MTGFVDLENAFDSVSRETNGKIMRHFVTPGKSVYVMMNMHENKSRKRMVEGCLRDSLQVKSGVVQDGDSSPFFVLVIGYIVKRSNRKAWIKTLRRK